MSCQQASSHVRGTRKDRQETPAQVEIRPQLRRHREEEEVWLENVRQGGGLQRRSQRCREMSVDICKEQGSTQDSSRDVGGGQRKEERDWTEGAGVSGETGSHGTSSCCVRRQQWSKTTERLGAREISSDRTGTSDR